MSSHSLEFSYDDVPAELRSEAETLKMRELKVQKHQALIEADKKKLQLRIARARADAAASLAQSAGPSKKH